MWHVDLGYQYFWFDRFLFIACRAICFYYVKWKYIMQKICKDYHNIFSYTIFVRVWIQSLGLTPLH